MARNITLAEAKRLGLSDKGQQPKRLKYGNRITFNAEGIRFDSAGEARRDAKLQIMQRAGLISKIKRQVPFALFVNGQKICGYVPDWTYEEQGQLVAEDFKGHETEAFKIKFKLAKALFPHIDWRVTR